MVRMDGNFQKLIDDHRKQMYDRHGVDLTEAEAIRSLAIVGLDKYDGTGDRKR